ncbi:MAG: ligand-binding sensor domain-containing protein [Saprospiraceae bacterium]|jgi:ligand-binding sensor domain-containing protein
MKNILSLCFAFICLYLQAQTFTNYTTAEGLINNSVSCLAVDANDDLWFGTQEGISHFDGTNWTSYDVISHPNLVSNTITALTVDSDNNLWIGTDFGLNKFDGSTWTTYTEADGLADDRIKYINQAPDGKIWIANNDGITIFDGTTWTSYTMADGLPFGGTNFVTFDSNGKAYLGTPLGGVWILDGTTFTSITEADGLLNDKIRSIAIDQNQHKWIGTTDGISVFNSNNEFITHHELIFELPPPDELNPVEDIQIAADGRIWVGVYVDYLVTEGGVSTFGNNIWEDYDVGDGLIGPVVRRLAIDGQGDVWVVTSTGISRISNIPVSTFDIETDRGIELYPNPTNSVLTLSVPSDLVGKNYQIFNVSGMRVETGIISNEHTDLALEKVAAGFYLLSIDGVYTKKIIVEK